MAALHPTSFMHHVETIRSQLGLSSNLRIGQVISKGHQLVGWRLDGNLVEAASRLYHELADQSMPTSPATVNVSHTTVLAGLQVGSSLDTEDMSDDDFQQGSLRPVQSGNKMYDPRHDTPSAYMGIVADFLRHEWQQEGLDAGEVWQEEYMASNQVSIYQGKK
ncbi:hypothetical protein GUITHDRAFT_155411 [Guillardia theta CCMP2712]|uniref:Uncharacterized protein n=2 Tax=Guillardia theta TaxID=55529 RepID=L1II22_GUITC|nr:hypothetical protein GUITHDRAFT_155411 [Guillardia theta CCMP2712]EKX35747.1 hypothetical protein GUITHDRAFT_155411 [Guillardia theta CCMP2712]|eukprot:XP_005822727.1 hypothetical protein GUITHDRAFT_155411 [Guillardia theta CCMP2712]